MHGEKSLATRAKQELDICCGSVADSSVVKEYIESLEKQLAMLEKVKKILIHSSAEKLQGVYFICGEAGEKDPMGLPEYISVCPAYGSDGFAMYKKYKDYSSPGY